MFRRRVVIGRAMYQEDLLLHMAVESNDYREEVARDVAKRMAFLLKSA